MQRALAKKARYLTVALIVVMTLFTLLDTSAVSVPDMVAAIVLLALSLVPILTWLGDPDRYGLPIYPLHAFSFSWAYALPLINAHEVVFQYSDNLRLGVALMMAGYLLLGNWVWRKLSSTVPARRRYFIGFGQHLSGTVLNLFLWLGLLYKVSEAAGWLYVLGNVGSVVRAVAGALMVMSVFALGYQFGSGKMKRRGRIVYVGVVSACIVVACSTLFLIDGLMLWAAAVGGYFFGGRRIPWGALVVAGLVFSLLHLGKEGMREVYWRDSRAMVVTPADYVEIYSQWVTFGIERLDREDQYRETSSRSLFERASVMHMLLLAVDRTPERLDYMFGSTYALIPLILVPRLLMPDKPNSLEANSRLSVRYGLQVRGATEHTSIAWGMPAEAYINFGVLGVFALALVLSSFYSMVAVQAKALPITSVRVMFAFLVTFTALNTEYISTVFVSVLFQLTVALLFALPIMSKVKVESESK